LLVWKRILVILIAAASLAYSPTVRSDSYSGVGGIELYSIYNFDGYKNNFRLKYKYFSLNESSDRAEIIDYAVSKSTDIIFDYLKSNNIEVTGCGHNHSIVIYEISSDDLNNNIRFSKAKYYPNSSFIYGFWEPTGDYNDIIVASYFNSDALFAEIISHEIAHYWYNRLNLSKLMGYSHEEFAIIIENKYKRL